MTDRCLRSIITTLVAGIKKLLHPPPIGILRLLGADGCIKAHLLPCGTNQLVFLRGVVCRSPLRQETFIFIVKTLLLKAIGTVLIVSLIFL
jgi:hypothetical protein